MKHIVEDKITERYLRQLDNLGQPRKKSESLLWPTKECYITGRTDYLHKHHIFGGKNRKMSEENGFFVYLIPEYHNLSSEGVHNDIDFRTRLQETCQKLYEENHTREEFILLVGRSYL